MKVPDELWLEERWTVYDLDRTHELLDGLEWAEGEAVRRAQKERDT